MNRRFRLCARAAALSLAVLLAACGGGDATVVAPVDPAPVVDQTAPVLALATTSPVEVTATFRITSDEPLADGPVVQAAAYPRLTGGTAAILPGTATLSADRRVIEWKATSTLQYDWVVNLAVTAQDTSGNTGTLSASVTTVLEPAPPGWPPPAVTAMGLKVFGANALPAGCETWRSGCWQQSVADGTVKFVAMGAGPTRDGRRVVFGYFRTGTGADTRWKVLPFFLDNGAAAAQDIGSGGSAAEIDYVAGSFEGVIYHQAGMPTCTELIYGSGSIWTPRGVACP